jgi:hypothetical protein
MTRCKVAHFVLRHASASRPARGGYLGPTRANHGPPKNHSPPFLGGPWLALIGPSSLAVPRYHPLAILARQLPDAFTLSNHTLTDLEVAAWLFT